MLFLCQRNLLPRILETIDLSRLLLFCQRYLRRLWLGSWDIFLESNSLLPPSQFSYRRGRGEAFDDLLTLFHCLQVALNSGMEGRLIQLNFSAAFYRVSLLYQLMFTGVPGQFLSIVSEFLNGQRVRLDGKVSASVDDVSRVTKDSV